MIRSKSMPATLNTLRQSYAYTPIPQKLTKKKRKTSPHPYTLEFADIIMKEIFSLITTVVNPNLIHTATTTSKSFRTIILIRFPILYGCIKDNFSCHRSELEDLIEYVRAYAIKQYSDSVTRSFQKTKLFKQKFRHLSQVKTRNILYAMSNTHYDCLGAIKILCGHTVIWRNTMYNTCKPTNTPTITWISNFFDLEFNTIKSPTKYEVEKDMKMITNYIHEDNILRRSFNITTDLVH